MNNKPDSFRFDADEFVTLARSRLLETVPESGVDLALPAARSDDDLNPHLQSSADDGVNSRPAAVLVPVINRAPELSVLLTQRTEALPTHAGQVAFPGGKIDREDEGPVATALRETEEETGLKRRYVHTIGFLDAYQTRTGFRIIPVVGLVEPGFDIVPEPGEVADVFEVPLRFLMDPANHQRHTRQWQGVRRTFYAMPYNERYIWGVTAGMLRNLYDRMYRI